MARRIDIELTSRRPDGSWTWRAPGARQPRGDVDAGLVPDGASVGDVLRADAEFELEGILVTAVIGTRSPTRPSENSGRIEVIGTGDSAGGVSVSYASGGRRRAPEDGPGERRRPPRAGEEGQRPRRSSEGARSPRDRKTSDAGAGPGRAQRRRPDGDAPERAGRRTRPERAECPEGAERGPRVAGRQRRPQPAANYRNAALAELRPEQLPVAEQLLRGGIPSLRVAIDEQNARARDEGRAPVSPEPLLAMAEELLPKLNLASWKDRATAVRDAGKDAPLREVRSVVAGASAVALDDEGRALQGALRQSLDTRVTALRESWLGRITGALDQGRVVDALQVAARAPEPAARIPAELAVRLAADAGAAMNSEVPDAQWTALLDAVVSSPVRRSVKPAGLPREPGADLLNSAHRAAGQVPELARLLGLPIPPPPGPRRPATAGARRS